MKKVIAFVSAFLVATSMAFAQQPAAGTVGFLVPGVRLQAAF